MGIIWNYYDYDDLIVKGISQKFNISRLLATVLYNRGVRADSEIRSFLYKGTEGIYNPFLLPDIDKAIGRINKALEINEKITIYGDYDVDGITSTAIMVDYLKSKGANVNYYIPDRIEEGYGVNTGALEKLYNHGTSLIITVDTGITALEEVKYANSLNMDIIITDHHECKEELPDAVAVINPKRNDSDYPYKELAGVGVAFKLIQAMDYENLDTIFLKYCDIVSVGTIADVVPLKDENRIIVSNGLKRLEETKNIGLQELIKAAEVKDKVINSYIVGFVLSPRINAAGRIGDANVAVELLLTKDRKRAGQIAQKLNEENKNRQKTENKILQDAIKKIEEENKDKCRVIVLQGEDWHHGVIGIVASRITDKYYRPCLLISCEDNVGKGSGRSIKGFNLYNALIECEELLDKFGGHELAAGLTLKEDNIIHVDKILNEYANNNIEENIFIPSIKIDCNLNENELTINTIKDLKILEPFGMGNPTPVFAIRNAKIINLRLIGDGKHVKITVKKGDKVFEAIGFNMAHLTQTFIEKDMADIAFNLAINSYNGRDSVQLVIKDMKLSAILIKANKYFKSIEGIFGSDIIKSYDTVQDSYINELHKLLIKFNQINNNSRDPFKSLIPRRKDLVAIYQYIKARSKNGVYEDEPFILTRRIQASYNIEMNYFKLIKCLQIFNELNLMVIETKNNNISIKMNLDIDKKVNIEKSVILNNIRNIRKVYLNKFKEDEKWI